MSLPVTAKKWLEESKKLFDPYIGASLQLRFNGTVIANNVVLQTVIPAKVTELQNPPEKRLNDKGRAYTPACCQLVLSQGTYVFAVEDTALKSTITGGLCLQTGPATLVLEYAHHHDG